MAGSSGGNKEFLKSIAEQKLKSFSIGAMGKRGVTRKEQEEMRKKQDEEEVGKVYQEFVSTFEDTPNSKVSKTWVKAGTFNAGNRKEDTSDHGKLYRPQSKLDIGLPAKKEESPKVDMSKRPEKPGKKKQTEKKKSNLEIFKEELKAIQEERQERHRIKSMVKSGGFGSGSAMGRSSSPSLKESSSYLGDVGEKLGSHDTGDPNTTNLYLGNLSPSLTEPQLLELFGKFGPLASIKIMWPRTEDEKARGRNCGFVAYMSRRDGERALNNLLGKTIDGFEMKMGWGKPVPIPLQPIYIPPAMLKLTLPPPITGLPFNCQPIRGDLEILDNVPDDPFDETFKEVVKKSTVKVVIPTERTTLCLINRFVEFVIREGPMFEAMIMNREMNNRNFQFLFENQSPEHIYYRWRLFSMLQGDSKDDWNPEPFRMFKGGSWWKPPTKNLFSEGMSDEMFEESERGIASDQDEKSRTSSDSNSRRDDGDRRRSDSSRSRSKSSRDDDRHSSSSKRSSNRNSGLSDSQRDRFEDMLRNLLPDRNPVAETMVWCVHHAESGEEVVECIAESLSIEETPLIKKIARLYLISDILHNCSVKGAPNVSYYRKGFQDKLPEIFTDLHQCYKSIESRLRAEAFKQRVMNCFRAWEDWALYPQDFLIKLQNIFLGLVSTELVGEEKNNGNEGDVDGKEMSDDDKDDDDDDDDDDDTDDVDGLPLDGAALLKSAQRGSKAASRKKSSDDDEDVDGAPMVEEPRRQLPAAAEKKMPPGFVPSKWETVDQETVQAQAVTSKWDIFDHDDEAADKRDAGDGEDIDGVPMQDDDDALDARVDEMRRRRLRDVEMKVMAYQDLLESGRETLKPGWTISEQVEQYRKKLNRRAREGAFDSEALRAAQDYSTPGRNDSDNDSRGRSKKKKSRSKRSSSSSRSRSRSRSRDRKRSRRRRSRSASIERSSSKRSSGRRSRSRSPSSRKSKKKRY